MTAAVIGRHKKRCVHAERPHPEAISRFYIYPMQFVRNEGKERQIQKQEIPQ
jgi:hypothetical protein